jgi:EAL domain-containing protein (putative c-di-GMP-specific phosphodiesterase class I)
VISVNLAVRQLGDPSLVDMVAGALAGADLAPRDLMLEITEGAMMADTESATRTLQAFNELGVRLAVDDFGTGYSSLAYLQRFPIDVLKIDRSFVVGLGRGPEDSALAKAIVRLARTLRLTAIAEGVETTEQLVLLRKLGCDQAQGFRLVRPQDADAVAALLATQPSLELPARI